MATYISLLRGINVVGKKTIKMEALKNMYSSLQLTDVRTYIQSGNVLFSSTERSTTRLEQKISAQIEKVFGWEVPVLVLKVKTLEKIISENPFLAQADKDPAFMHVTFLANPCNGDHRKAFEERAMQGEDFFLHDKAIFLYCPQGYGITKLHNNFIEKQLQVKATTRNWRTVNILCALAKET